MGPTMNIVPAREILLNSELSQKFNEELKKLEEKKGVSRSLELSMRVQKLHDANEELVAIFEKFGDWRTFEIFLALLGYDKTKFEMREPLDEKILLALLEPELTEIDFYFLVYADFAYTKDDVWQVIFGKGLVSAEEYFGAISALAKNTRLTVAEIRKRTEMNRRIVNKFAFWPVRYRDICRIFPETLPDKFEEFIKREFSDIEIRAMSRVCVSLAQGKIAEEDFLRLLEIQMSGSGSLVKALKEIEESRKAD